MPPSKTGPKTAAGKLAVRHNALRHGLVTEIPLLPGLEDEHEWDLFRLGYVGALDPQGGYETALAERAARLEWRIMRVERYEAELIAAAKRRAGRDVADATQLCLAHEVGLPDELEKVQRYEAHLQRIQTTVLHELEAAQKRRRGLDAPLARLDLTAFPSYDAYAAAVRRTASRRGHHPDPDLLGTFTPDEYPDEPSTPSTPPTGPTNYPAADDPVT